MQNSPDITQLLIDWGNGDNEALEKLFPFIEKELQRIAHNNLRRVKPGDSLQTAVVINEAYLHLVEHKKVDWQNRAHFFSVAAIVMRQFLLNYIRTQQRLKRGGGLKKITLGEMLIISDQKSNEILALEEAMLELAEFDERKAKVVELKFYGGLTVTEIAQVLQISEMTVIRDWNMAKAWLASKIR